MEPKVIGLCKECMTVLTAEHEIPEYIGIFECPSCSYPNTRGDMWFLTHEQYEEAMAQWKLDIAAAERRDSMSSEEYNFGVIKD